MAVQENAKGRGKSKSASSGATMVAAVSTVIVGAMGGLASNAHAAMITGYTGTTTGGYCTTGANSVNGVSYAQEIDPIDGNGTYSMVVGCSASGGNNLAVTAYGAFASTTGNYATAIGFGTKAAANATALGFQTMATGSNATAMGFTANANGASATAIGSAASASGTNATALGASSTASGSNGIAIGNSATSMAGSAVAIGTAATGTGTNSVAIGVVAKSIAYGVAVGNGATVASTDGNSNGVALGTGSYANGGAASTGYQATASGSWSTALGPNATASATNAVALGYGTTASTANSVALGNGATTAAAVATTNGVIGGTTYTYAGTAPTGVVSMGKAGAERQVTNVAAGRVTSTSTDAVNGSQLYATNTQVTQNTGDISNIYTKLTNLSGGTVDAVLYDSSAHTSVTLGGTGASSNVKLSNVAAGTLSSTSTDAVNGSQLYATNNTVNNIVNGGGIKYFHTNSSLGDSVAAGLDSTAIGPASTAGGANSVAIGNASTTMAQNAVAIGTGATSLGNDAIVIGSAASSIANGVALGKGATVTSTDGNNSGIALGNGAIANGVSVSTGYQSTASGSWSTALGPWARATGANAVAVGTSATASGANATALGNGANASTANSVALGNGATTAAAVATTNGVIGGTTYTYAGTSPTGVVSVGKAGAERQVQNVAAGQVTSSSTDAVNGSQLYATNTQVTANTTSISNLQGSVTTLQGNVTTMQGQITNINGKLADAVMYDSSAHTSVTLGGTGASTNVKLSNVAAGTLSSTSTDAVNGSQLYATNNSVTSVTNTVNNIVNGGGIKYFHTNSSLADSVANGANSTAIGPAAAANYADDIAIGDGAAASRPGINQQSGNVALGANATAQGYRSIAIGVGAQTNTGSLWQYASDIAIGQSALSEGYDSVALGNNANAGSAGGYGNNVAVGGSSYAKASGAVAFGGAASAAAANSTAIGALASTSAAGAVAIGTSATASDTNAVALGQNAKSTGTNSAALGGLAQATGLRSVAVGAAAQATADTSVALGNSATAGTVNSVALGTSSVTSAAVATANGVIGGTTFTYAGTSPTGVVSVGKAGAERQVQNVAAGQVTSSSTDAVNGSQLYATNTQVTANTTSISNLQGSVTTLQGNVTTMQGQITNINGKLADAVMYDSSAHTSVTLGGTGASTNVKLSNVAAGTLSSTSTDAVNGSQLYATNTNVSNLTGTVTNIAGNVTTMQGQITNINGKLADAVLYDSSAHTSVTLGGTGASTNVKLSNVAAGTLSSTSTDAVNGSQLYATNNTVNNIVNGGGIKYFHTNSSLGDSVATGANSTAIGPVATASAANAIAIGNGANASTANSVALGNGATTAAAVATTNGVIGGTTYTYAGTTPTGVVSMGAAGTEREVTNVAAGRVTSTSTDAVNGSQLYATNTQVTANTTSISNLQGSVTTLQGDVSNLAGNVTNINGKLADAVLYDSSAHTSVTLGGTGASTNVKLSNVAAGALSSTSTDAVNGSQLYAT
ncbi:hypothetical protein, partial [Paraburkholderia tropica]|uniref:beta strand repeat-containing protein n=1 Tax=Paraburkholderia tropica TaxID=92647 RepID=UPI002097EC08